MTEVTIWVASTFAEAGGGPCDCDCAKVSPDSGACHVTPGMVVTENFDSASDSSVEHFG